MSLECGSGLMLKSGYKEILLFGMRGTLIIETVFMAFRFTHKTRGAQYFDTNQILVFGKFKAIKFVSNI